LKSCVQCGERTSANLFDRHEAVQFAPFRQAAAYEEAAEQKPRNIRLLIGMLCVVFAVIAALMIHSGEFTPGKGISLGEEGAGRAMEGYTDNTVVKFADREVYYTCARILEKTDITVADMKKLTFFWNEYTGFTRWGPVTLPTRRITTLFDLRYCEDLQNLAVRQHSVADISLLSSLTTLTALDIQGNDVRDYSPLLSLVNLKVLYVDRGADAEVLAELEKRGCVINPR
jgi:hypothetical protein